MTPEISVIRLTESGSFAPQPKDTLIVGPGMGTAATPLYASMALHLDERFQVIGFDLPGHDQSPVHHDEINIRDLANKVAELVTNMRRSGTIRRDSRVYFAGTSISGQIALQLALRHPELFEGIAVIASAAKIGEPADWEQRAALVREQGTESMVEASAGAWTTPEFAENNAKVLQIQKNVLANADDETYAQLCEALGRFDLRKQLDQIRVPLTVVAGRADAMCTVADAEFITERVDGATVHVVEDAAHLIPLEKPEELAQILQNAFN